MNSSENKKWYLVIAVFILIVIFAGTTYSYFKWTTSTEQRTNIILTITQKFMCEADGGGNITDNEKYLVPTDCTNSDYAVIREINVKPTVFGEGQMHLNLWLDVNALSSGLSGSNNFKYALTTKSNSCTDGVIKEGTFKGKRAGDKIQLFNYVGYTTSTEETYYLYIWLDKVETSASTMDQLFDLSLNGNCTDAPESKTFIVYSQEDTTLRLYKRDNEVSDVSNNVDEVKVSKLNINQIDDEIIYDDKKYIDLENTVYTSEEQLPWYEYRDSITKIIIEDDLLPISTAYWFKGLKNVTSIDLSKLDTSKVTDMKYMFSGMSKLTSIDLNSFNTSNVKDMSYMFQDLGLITNIDISHFNTSKVTTMKHMFSGMSKLANIDLLNFNTSKVQRMEYMFNGCSSLSNLDLSKFNTSNVVSMHNMFSECSSLISLNLSSFKTTKVQEISKMFNGCSSLVSIDLSHFNTGNVTNAASMFNGCSSLISLILSNWNVSKMSNMNNMFNGCSSLTSIDLSSFNPVEATNMFQLFYNCTNLLYVDLRNVDFSYVSGYYYMFYNFPNNAQIVVKDGTQKDWMNGNLSSLTKSTLNIVIAN